MLSLTTDYARVSTGDPSPYLRRIAGAGFTHVHWCHQWNTDFLYARCEIRQIAAWLAECGLSLLDLHGSVGPEKHWTAAEEYRRLAGVELVENRLDMCARLGGEVVIMHAGVAAVAPEAIPDWDALRRSLDALQPLARCLGVHIAIENGEWPVINALLAAYPPDFLGLCYDSGHGNYGTDGLSELARLKDRLISIHLHDNDGTRDEHRLPFTGTVDWTRVAALLAASSYRKCISLEATISDGEQEDDFLAGAFAAASRLARMLDEANPGRGRAPEMN